MKESDLIRKYVRPYLESMGARVIKYHGGVFSEVGVSDLLVCLDGKFLALETKMKGNTPTPMQLSFIRSILKAGGKAGVVYSHSWKEDIDRILSSDRDLT